MNFIFVKAETHHDLERFFPVFKELRPHLSFERFVEIYQKSRQADHYEIVGIESGGHVLALMGYRVLHDMVRGTHLYIDDLVTTEGQRSKGWGEKLLNYAEKIAPTLGCQTLRLCTGLDNEGGQRFYEKHGWTKGSFAYRKKLNS
jgi:ribosomal protein S18 acetylase RimI-like enzyme